MIFKVSVQNIRVWGDVSTLASDDQAMALHEAWAEAILSEKFSMKLGRQEIDYDDSRIFGNVGWAQQARSHDAFLFKITPNENQRVDVGIAYDGDLAERSALKTQDQRDRAEKVIKTYNLRVRFE